MSFFRVMIFLFLSCFNLCQGEEKPLILVSIPTYQGILQELLGEDFSVESVVPENINFHSYEPSMQKMLLYAKARLWFTIGDPFEHRLEQFLRNQKQPPEIVSLDPLAKGSLRKVPEDQENCCCNEAHAEIDPHSWTSPRTVRDQLKIIVLTIERLFPDTKESIETNYARLDAKVVRLIATVDDLLRHARNKPVLVAHAAFGYLCHDYGIQQIALESGGKEPTPAHLLQLLIDGKEHHITTVFSLKGFPKKGIERIGEVLHARVVELDPYVYPYFETMEYTATEIKKALDDEV